MFIVEQALKIDSGVGSIKTDLFTLYTGSAGHGLVVMIMNVDTGINMSVKIQDEFTSLRVSRARKSQLRRRRDGMCECGHHRITKVYCADCLSKFRKYGRKRRKHATV